MLLRALPLVFVLVGVVLYTVLGGADFGAGFWQLPPAAARQPERRSASTPTTRSVRSGRRTTSG